MTKDLRKNIILTGFMGTGKTITGRALAWKLKRSFIDTDTLIEKEAGIPIREIFERFGEPHFRAQERAAVQKVSEEHSAVIAVGGGAIVNPENLDDLRRNGIIVCLTASPEVILSRVERNSDRPLLEIEDKIGKIKELMNNRAAYYEKSDITINTDNKMPEQVAIEILDRLQAIDKWSQ